MCINLTFLSSDQFSIDSKGEPGGSTFSGKVQLLVNVCGLSLITSVLQIVYVGIHVALKELLTFLGILTFLCETNFYTD